jgi:uncharacterized protein (DUF1800 family)
MVLTPRPFEEKMTLFWHNHFATSDAKTGILLAYFQNLTLRTHALARFDELLLKVAQDPAMLIWLDGITNLVGRPNENFARELQELFTMGPRDAVTGEPNYTEDDVKEVARAFTGWTFITPKKINVYKPHKYQFVVREPLHDGGAKTIYGQTANYTGEDIIAIIAARRATARFLVKRFFEFFVYPLTDSAEDLATIEKFADVYMNTNHSIKEVARAIFRSDEFFGERARFALVKTPVDLVVGAVRALEADYEIALVSPIEYGYKLYYRRLGDMGMDLFAPPDVAGWNLNLAWINPTFLIERFNFANALISNRETNPLVGGPFVTVEQLRRHTGPSADETVDNFLRLLGPIHLDPETRNRLINFLQTDSQGNPSPFKTDNETIENRVRGLAHQIMCLPEYEMN